MNSEIHHSLINYLEVDELKNFIDCFKAPKTIKPEKTIFDVGLRGHFENPMSELLAFYLNPNEDHGLGPIVLKTFLEYAELSDLPTTQMATPTREWPLNDGKRIDLVLEGKDWVIAIENKIFSPAFNDFSKYKDEIETRYNKIRKEFLIVAPYNPKKEKEGWKWISTAGLMDCIKRKLEDEFNKSSEKWIVFLNEFAEYLIKITGVSALSGEEIQKISEDIKIIKDVSDLYTHYVDQIKTLLSKDLSQHFEHEKISTAPAVSDWTDLGKAIIFRPFNTDDYRITFLIFSSSRAKENGFRVQYSIPKLNPVENDLIRMGCECFSPFLKSERNNSLHSYFADSPDFEASRKLFLLAAAHIIKFRKEFSI
jgi:hypothetical protein